MPTVTQISAPCVYIKFIRFNAQPLSHIYIYIHIIVESTHTHTHSYATTWEIISECECPQCKRASSQVNHTPMFVRTVQSNNNNNNFTQAYSSIYTPKSDARFLFLSTTHMHNPIHTHTHTAQSQRSLRYSSQGMVIALMRRHAQGCHIFSRISFGFISTIFLATSK